jgi:hypothetical protein
MIVAAASAWAAVPELRQDGRIGAHIVVIFDDQDDLVMAAP